MNIKILYFLILTSFFNCTLLFSQDYEQPEDETLDDPFSKPTLWARLKTTPEDDDLWQKYFGKDLFELSEEEYTYYEQLRNKLIQDNIEWVEEVESKKNIRLQKQRNVISKEDPYYLSLLENITRNFAMIELYFYDEFEKYNSEYVTYEEVYPNGDYNKRTWVTENDKRLKELKMSYYSQHTETSEY